MTEESRTEALSQLIYKCAKEAFLELFKNKEHYYNCVLLAPAEGYAPILSAWSFEALDREIPNIPKKKFGYTNGTLLIHLITLLVKNISSLFKPC